MSAREKMKASAKKSLGEYKAVIVHANHIRADLPGRTEILGKRMVFCETVPFGNLMVPNTEGPTKFKRGKTFPTRDEAIAYAQREIDGRLARRASRSAT